MLIFYNCYEVVRLSLFIDFFAWFHIVYLYIILCSFNFFRHNLATFTFTQFLLFWYLNCRPHSVKDQSKNMSSVFPPRPLLPSVGWEQTMPRSRMFNATCVCVICIDKIPYFSNLQYLYRQNYIFANFNIHDCRGERSKYCKMLCNCNTNL